VEGDGWVVVDISEIPGAFAPADEPELTWEQRQEARARLRIRPPEQTARNERAASDFPDFGHRWHAIRQNLGIKAGPGQLLYAKAGVLRSATALDDDTLVLAIGGLPGSYTPPIWSADWRPPLE